MSCLALTTFNTSSAPTARPRTIPSATTQPKKTLNADWRSKTNPLQYDNHLGAASPSTSKKASTSKAKGKRAAKGATVDSDIEDDESDALKEKEMGIENEMLEKFDRDAAGLGQVRRLSHSTSLLRVIPFVSSSM